MFLAVDEVNVYLYSQRAYPCLQLVGWACQCLRLMPSSCLLLVPKQGLGRWQNKIVVIAWVGEWVRALKKIIPVRIQVHCHKYKYIVTSTSTLSRVQVHCHEYKYIVTSTSTLSRVQVHCHEYKYIVTSTSTLSRVQVLCHEYKYIVMSTSTLSWVQVHCHEYKYFVMSTSTLSWVQVHCHEYKYFVMSTSTLSYVKLWIVGHVNMLTYRHKNKCALILSCNSEKALLGWFTVCSLFLNFISKNTIMNIDKYKINEINVDSAHFQVW